MISGSHGWHICPEKPDLKADRKAKGFLSMYPSGSRDAKKGMDFSPVPAASSIRRSTMKKHRALSFGLWLALMPGLAILPASMLRAAEPPIAGAWEGTLDPGAQPKKRILVHISTESDGSLTGAIDYPDQSISGVPITAITYHEPALHFESSSMHTAYDGTMNKDNSKITGTWKDGGAPLALVLTKTP